MRQEVGVQDLALGIDLGTTAVKVGLFTVEDGRTVAVSSQAYELSTPQPGWVELDAEVYFERTVAGVRDALRATPSGCRVVSIGLSSQGQTFVMLDAEGRPVRPAIVWIDTRATAESDELAARLPREGFYRTTGIPFPNAVDSAPKILWVRRHEPDVFARTAHVLVLPSYLAYRLTGRMVADATNARSMALLDDTGRWWDEAVDAVGLRMEQLGEVVRPGTLIGPLTCEAAEAMGLPSGTPVSAGTNDQSAGALSMGNREPGRVSATVGTAMAIQCSLESTVDPFPSGLLVSRHPLGDHWLVLSYMKTAAIVLTWFRDAFAPGASYEDLAREAADVPPGAGGLTCLPHLSGMGTPSFDGSVRGGFLSVGMEHTRKHFVRAVLESVCFGARDGLDQMRLKWGRSPFSTTSVAPATALAEKGLRPHFSELTVSGGATRSDLWMQVLADCLGIPVTVAECGEAACRGGAMLGLLGAGHPGALSWPASADDRAPRTFTPDPSTRAAYDGGYGRYLKAMDTLYPNARETRA